MCVELRVLKPFWLCVRPVGLVVLLMLAVLSQSACALHELPVVGGFFPAPPAEETPAPPAEEEAEGEEGEGEATEVKPQPLPPAPARPAWASLPHTALSLTTADGAKLAGKLYTPHLLAHPPQPPDPEAEEEEAPAEDEEGEEATPHPPAYHGKTYPLVILLHGLGEDADTWAYLGPVLLKNGYAVLALDLRGHGQSLNQLQGAPTSWRWMEDTAWQKLPADVLLWVRQWPELLKTQHPEVAQGRSPILMGAGLGANVALIAAGNRGKVKANSIAGVVALSPTLNAKGLQPALALLNVGVPTLFVASQSEPHVLESTEKLYALAQGKKQLQVYKAIGSGSAMLELYPPLAEQLVAWLKKQGL
jgi:predicted esterase